MTESPPTAHTEADVRRLRKMLEDGQFAHALAHAETLVLQMPENRDVLYMLAVSQRYLNLTDRALQTLERLEGLHHNFSRLYQERGHCFVALRDAPHAIEAYLEAVNINAALPASWARLESLYQMIGDPQNAALAAGHVAKLRTLPTEIVSATAAFSDGDLELAESVVRAYLLQHGNHIEAMRLLARIGIARGVLDDAEVLLEAVLEWAPDYRAARFELAQVLLDRHKHPQAREQLEKLLSLDPGNRQYLTLYATTCVGLGQHDEAITLYRRLLPDAVRAEELHLSIGHSLKTLGSTQQAVESYRAAAAARPDFGDAFWSLANLKTYRFSADEIGRMRQQESAPRTQLTDRIHLCFALGKALEDRGDYAESWKLYTRGNALKRAAIDYSPKPIERNTRLQIELCTREFLADRAGLGAAGPDPIFIVGLPRAGSTLIEQILASHSQVEGTHELADIPRLVHELQGRSPDSEHPPYPAVLAELTAADLRRLGENYLRDTRIYRTTGAYFIDKMPNNFRHLGLIHLLLPNARIIDARREPLACCVGNLKQLFASGQEFTYSVTDIARYYRTYLELMRHWNEVLPGKLLRVQHEDLVEDLEGSVRRILAFCGLGFEPGCVEFHKTARSVRTASSEQVRQPIFRDGLSQWRNFEPWLGPLRDALGDALLRFRE